MKWRMHWLDWGSVWADVNEGRSVEFFIHLRYLFEVLLSVSGVRSITRFYLCGGLDASDWILANIVALSTIPSTRVKVLVGYIIQWIAEGTFDVRGFRCEGMHRSAPFHGLRCCQVRCRGFHSQS